MVEVLYELPLIGAAIVLRSSWAYISRKDERERDRGGGMQSDSKKSISSFLQNGKILVTHFFFLLCFVQKSKTLPFLTQKQLLDYTLNLLRGHSSSHLTLT